jgi:hypothetical protein
VSPFDPPDNAPGHDRLDRGSDPTNDVLILAVEKYSEDVGPSPARNITVPEVHAQQVRVSGKLVLVEGFEPPLSRV